MRSEAARAEQFAERTRLMVDEPKATRRMNELAQGLYDASDTGVLLERAVEGAMALLGADLGNVQLRDLTNGGLRIAAQSGFGSEFLEYFEVVRDDTSACGRAANQRSQTVIVDVEADVAFASHREIAAASRFRAVQSTPLVDPAERLLGVISTHFGRPHRPPPRELQLMEWFAEHVAAALAQRQNRPITLVQPTAVMHEQTAALHEASATRLAHVAGALLTDENETQALAIQAAANRAVNRARQERARARALAARVGNGYPSRLFSPGPARAASERALPLNGRCSTPGGSARARC